MSDFNLTPDKDYASQVVDYVNRPRCERCGGTKEEPAVFRRFVGRMFMEYPCDDTFHDTEEK